VGLLAERFVNEIAARLGRKAPAIGEATRARLESYSWPGNVRELRNVIERALILDAGPALELPDLPSVRQPEPAEAAADLNLRSVLDRREKEALIEALRSCDGRRSEAARMLGIDPRNLSYYLRKHGID
jgi:DNA-binding NtrC family response regulator